MIMQEERDGRHADRGRPITALLVILLVPFVSVLGPAPTSEVVTPASGFTTPRAIDLDLHRAVGIGRAPRSDSPDEAPNIRASGSTARSNDAGSRTGLLTTLVVLLALGSLAFAGRRLWSARNKSGDSIDGSAQPERPTPALPQEVPSITLEVGDDGGWIEAVVRVGDRVYRSRGAPTQTGIIEAMVAAVTAHDPEPPPFPVAVTKTSIEGDQLLVLVLEHPGGRLTAGVAPLRGPMTEVLEGAVLSALGWPIRAR